MTSAGRTPNVRLRQSREERGWSQERLAAELRRFAAAREGREAGVTGNMICKWEKGDKKPSLRYQRLLRALLRKSSIELGFIEDGDLTTGWPAGAVVLTETQDSGDDSVERRSFLRLMAAGGAAVAAPAEPRPWDRLTAALRNPAGIDATMVDDLASKTAGLYKLEERVAAHRMLDRVTGHLATLSRLLEASPRTPFRRQLASTAGETAALAGWLCFDMRDHATARAYYRAAADAAAEADDNALWGCVLGYQSYLPAPPGRPSEPCVLLQEAQRRAAGNGTVLSRAWLAGREAEEQATRGDANAALRALGRAQAAFEHGDHDADRVWAQFFDRGRLDSLKVATYVRLRLPGPAMNAADEALASLGTIQTKKRALVLTEVAAAHVQQRDVGHACRLATDALVIVTDTDFTLGLQRIRQVRHAMEPWRAAQPVRELDEQLRAAVA